MTRNQGGEADGGKELLPGKLLQGHSSPAGQTIVPTSSVGTFGDHPYCRIRPSQSLSQVRNIPRFLLAGVADHAPTNASELNQQISARTILPCPKKRAQRNTVRRDRPTTSVEANASPSNQPGKPRQQPISLMQCLRDAGIDTTEPHLKLTARRRPIGESDLMGCIGNASSVATEQVLPQELASHLPTSVGNAKVDIVHKPASAEEKVAGPATDNMALPSGHVRQDVAREENLELDSPGDARGDLPSPTEDDPRPRTREERSIGLQAEEGVFPKTKKAEDPGRDEAKRDSDEQVHADAARQSSDASSADTAAGGGNGTHGGGGSGGDGPGGGGGGNGDDGSASGGDGEMDPKMLGLRRQRREDIEFREGIRKGMRECRDSLMTVGLFSLVINILVLAIPVYLFQVSDRVLTSRSTDTLIMLTVVVIGALAIYAMLDVVRRVLLMRVAAKIEAILSAPVLKAATKSAQLGSTREFQTLQDLQQLRNFITGPVLLTMFDAPVAPLYFLVVYLVHPELGVILTVAALLLVAVALLNQQLTAVLYSRANAFSQRANYQAEGMARNAQAVNAMGMVREGTWLWGREMAEALKSQIEAQDRNVLMTGVSKFLRMGTQVALLGWGAYLAIQGQLTGGMMIAASIIASRALAPIEGLIEGWRSYVGARSGYSRIMTLINSTPLATERLLLPRPTGRLHVERVLFVPPPTKKVVLNGLDFKLDPGESIAIVGPSGTGKSTLAKMLVGAIHPTSGSVRLDMMDIRNWDPRQFGECVGYLPQDVELFPGTIKANIARLREDAPDELIFDAAELAGVTSMIADLPHGYETQIAIDGSPLSGGQRQRLGLARAFYGSPRLVVLDEPNSNLDTAGEQALAGALVRAKERGITVVSVTQRPSLLKSVDKIMLMNEGRIQAFGARDEMLPRLGGPPRSNPPPTQAA